MAKYLAPNEPPRPAPDSPLPPKHTIAAPRPGCECVGCEVAREVRRHEYMREVRRLARRRGNATGR